MRGLEIFDRVGGGDSFASGLVYGLLSGADLGTALAYGVAHGALAMTTPGDTSMATLEEVERVRRGGAPPASSARARASSARRATPLPAGLSRSAETLTDRPWA